MTFRLPNSIPPGTESLLHQACIAGGGFDQTPVPTKVEVQSGQLIVSRSQDESGYLVIPWSVGTYGAIATTTTTLRERSEPYSLVIELARGKLNQVRSQTADWREIGLQTSPEFDRELEEVTRLFGTAALNHPSSESDAAATQVLEKSYLLADKLAQLYMEQMFATRFHEDGKLETWFTARYVSPPSGNLIREYRRAFNAARIELRWKDVEPAESQYNWAIVDRAIAAARANGLPVAFGPIIDITPGMLPAWAAGWVGDLPTLAAFMCDYLETLIGRYRTQVRRWVVCAGFNHSDSLGLADDDRLRLAARLFEAALQLDPDLDLSLGVAQPWGDYLVHDEQTISPLAFADDLIRTGLRISGLELELRNGTTPRGAVPRDLLNASRLMDLYGLLGLPLEVMLSHPSSGKSDPLAQEYRESVWGAGWPHGPTPERQAEWGGAFATMALCKPQVRAVTWDHWSDADPHLTPSGGLVDSVGRANPLLARFQAMKAAILR